MRELRVSIADTFNFISNQYRKRLLRHTIFNLPIFFFSHRRTATNKMNKCSEMETYCLGSVLYTLIDKSYRIVFAIWHAEIRLAGNVQQMPEQNSIIIYGIGSLGPRLFLCHISHQRRPMCMEPKQNISGIAHTDTPTACMERLHGK